MSKTNIKTICNNISEGKILEAIALIKEANVPFDTNQAIQIILYCVTKCGSLKPEENLGKEIEELLKIIIPYIKEPNGDQTDKYYQLIFHFMKKNMKDKQMLLDMKEFVTPHFKPSVMSSNQKKAIRNIVVLYYQTLAEVIKLKDAGLALKLTKTIISIDSTFIPDVEWLDDAINCANYLWSMQNVDIMQDFYLFSIGLLSRKEPDVDCCQKFLKFLSIQFKLGSTLKLFKKLEILLKDISQLLEELHITKYVQLNHIFQFIVAFYPETKKSNEELKSFTTSIKKLCNFSPAFDILYTHTEVVMRYYLSAEDKWIKINLNDQLVLLERIFEIANITKNPKCNCGCKTNLYYFNLFLYLYMNFAFITLKKSEIVTDDYLVQISQTLMQVKNINYRTAGSKCEKMKTFWSNNLRRLSYKLAMIFYQKYQKYSYKLVQLFFHTYQQFEKFNTQDGDLEHLFLALIHLSMNKKEPKKCMYLAALYAYAYQKYNDNTTSFWIRAKIELKGDEEVQKMTYKDALELCTQYPEFKLPIERTNEVETKALEIELQSYSEKWSSKIPMMHTVKELCNVADIKSLILIILKVYGNCDKMIHMNMPVIFHEIMKKYKVHLSEQHELNNWHLAHFNFVYYSYCFKQQIMKNMEDMEQTKVVQDVLDKQTKVITHPDDKCDLVSVYDSLKLDKYNKMIKHLNESLMLITASIHNPVDYPDAYKLLIGLGYEYLMHKLISKSVQAFNCGLIISEKSENKKNIIQCTGYLLENADEFNDTIKKLMNRADELCIELENSSDIETKKIIITYYLCKVKCLIYHNHIVAYQVLEKAQDMFSSITNDQMKILNVQLLMMQYRFNTFPSDMIQEECEKNPLVLIHSAVNLVTDHSFVEQGNSYAQSVRLDVYEEIVKFYTYLCLPREVRCYGKFPLSLTQKLVLPLRNLAFLYYLTLIDIETLKFDDCQVKLNGISDILGLTCIQRAAPEVKKTESLANANPDGVPQLVNCMREMVLDVPQRRERSQSPTLKFEEFKMPSFLLHEVSCRCFFCSTCEYQRFILMKCRLDAYFYIYYSNFTQTESYINGGFEVYETLKKTFLKSSNMLGQAYKDLLPTFDDVFLETYCEMLHDYSLFLQIMKRENEALNVNHILLDNNLILNKTKYTFLFNKALVQRVRLLYKPNETVKDNVSEQASSIEDSLTPESKINERSAPKLQAKKKVSRVVNPTKLNLSEEESPVEEKKLTVIDDTVINYKKLTRQTNQTGKPTVVVYKAKEDKLEPRKSTNTGAVKKQPIGQTNLLNRPRNLKGGEKQKENDIKEADPVFANRTKLLTNKLRNTRRTVDNKENVTVEPEIARIKESTVVKDPKIPLDKEIDLRRSTRLKK